MNKQTLDSKLLAQPDEALDLYMDSLFGKPPQESTATDNNAHNEPADSVSQTENVPLQPQPEPDSQSDNTSNLLDNEAPKVDLSLFLPKVPSEEELELIEQKQQQQQLQALEQKLNQTVDENKKLKQELEVLHEKLDEYAKTHTEIHAPQWAHPEFQILLFDVGRLKLALPVVSLNSIVVWEAKYITEMPGSEDWYLGLIQHLGKSIPVIDTLKQVVPPERIERFVSNRKPFKNIVIIGKDDNQWGLVCEQIIGIKTVPVEAVKWRSDRTSRRWLLGTVKEYMCALLDTTEFAAMLSTGKGSFFEKK